MRTGGAVVPRVVALQRRAILVAALSVGGCTSLAPIQAPKDDRRFALDVASTEPVPCIDPDDGRSRLCDAKLKDSLDTFEGDLAREIWLTDLRRRELAAQGMEKAQLTNAYNALLWPVGAFFIAKKIHHPGWSTLDTAAVAAASYGLLSSGIPDRDKLYLRTSDRMACMMVAFEPLLYRKYQIDAPKDNSAETPTDLQGRITWLKKTTADFKARRDELVATLKARAGRAAAPVDPSFIAATRARAQGKKSDGGMAAGNLQTFLDGFLRETDRLLAETITLVRQAEDTVVLIQDSGKDLWRQRSRANQALNSALVAGTGDIVSPEARARAIVAMVQSNLTASKAFSERIATLTKQSGAGQESTWMLTAARLQELDATSQNEVLAFWTQIEKGKDGPRLKLIAAQDWLASWMNAHQKRVSKANELVADWHCSDDMQDEFSKQLLKVVSDASTAAAAAAAQASGAGK